MRLTWKIGALAAACAALVAVATCANDVLKRARVKTEGTITGPALDGSGDGPIANVYVDYPRDPGNNTASERQTESDRHGHYSLSADFNRGWWEPLYFFLFGYYEQNRVIWDKPTSQPNDVVLRSAYDKDAPHSCATLCERFVECEEFFQITYHDAAQCEAHCAQGCKSSYLSCAYSYDETGHSTAAKCQDLWDCYKSDCDPAWLNQGDDTGDDTGA